MCCSVRTTWLSVLHNAPLVDCRTFFTRNGSDIEPVERIRKERIRTRIFNYGIVGHSRPYQSLMNCKISLKIVLSRFCCLLSNYWICFSFLLTFTRKGFGWLQYVQVRHEASLKDDYANVVQVHLLLEKLLIKRSLCFMRGFSRLFNDMPFSLLRTKTWLSVVVRSHWVAFFLFVFYRPNDLNDNFSPRDYANWCFGYFYVFPLCPIEE